MNKLQWCARKKGGLQIVDPNPNLANAYFKKAEEALESLRVNTIKDWKISTTYYTMYFSVYALLMKIGVKCEIHSCTIEFAQQYLITFFNDDDIQFLKNSLKARIDSQYYIDRTVPDRLYSMMVEKAPLFFVQCKQILIQLNEKRIKEIREVLKKSIQ